MNRFRIKRDVYSPQEALLNWALTKRAPADPISHISAEEKKALTEDYKLRLDNEFKSTVNKKIADELIEYTAEIEVENQFLKIELARLDIFEAVDSLYQKDSKDWHSYAIRDSLMKLLMKVGNRFPGIAQLFTDKYISYKGSQGGKKRAKNDIKSKYKEEIEQEFLMVKDRFTERNYKSLFCRKMAKKYDNKLSLRAIQEFVTHLKRKYNIVIK